LAEDGLHPNADGYGSWRRWPKPDSESLGTLKQNSVSNAAIRLGGLLWAASLTNLKRGMPGGDWG